MRFHLEPLLTRISQFRWILLTGALLLILAPFALWLGDLDRQIIDRMSSKEPWQLPARVYARPLEIFEDQALSIEDLTRELTWLGYRTSEFSPDNLPEGFFLVEDQTIRFSTRGYEFTDGSEPPRQVTLSIADGKVIKLDAGSADQFFVRLEPMEIGSIHPGQHEDRVVLTADDYPPGFEAALVAVEDRSFMKHHGISIRGIVRATLVNLRHGSKAQGASTLTQQLVKNLFLTSEKTYSRKLTEIFMAIVLDWRYSKSEILETFTNEVFLTQDGNRAIHGFGLASEFFFDRPFSELLPHEYALLIGMLKAPSRYNPVRHPERAQQRRDVVLELIHRHGDLPEADKTIALEQPIGITGQGQLNSGTGTEASDDRDYTRGNPAYLDAVRRQLLRDYPITELQDKGLRIYTNYDPIVQFHTEQSVARTIDSLARRYGSDKTTEQYLQVASVVTEPNTGEVKAMVGGRQSRLAGFNRALDASRPVGSLLKPAIFLTAWMDPDNHTLASLIADEPVSIDLPNGSVWEPENFSGEAYGEVTALEALSRSLNLASINLGMEIGLPKIIQSLKSLGIESPLPEIPALMLGAHGFNVMEIARMYQTIAAGGFITPTRTIREVVDQTGTSVTEYPITLTQHFDPDSIYLLKYAMATAMLSGTGRSAGARLRDDFPVAGKTGTSDDQRDSWFAGFSGDYLAVVWMGNDNNTPTPLTGSSGALAVWSELFSRISRIPIDLTPPETITFNAVDPATGQQVADRCQASIKLPFVEGSAPEKARRCPGEKSLSEWFRALIR